MKTLLLDLTSLDTPSRLRGQGRYVRDLAVGLSHLPATALGNLRLLALTHLGIDGSFRVAEELDAFSGKVSVPTSRDHYRVAYARRVGLWRAARRTGAAGVHLGVSSGTPLFMYLSGCQRIVTCHDAIPSYFPKRYMGWRDGGPFVGKAIEQRRYRSADLVIAISEATKRDVVERYGVPEARVERVYNGVDVDRWAAQPELASEATLARFGLVARPFALYVGGLHWHKNVRGMLAGVARARSLGEDLHLVWAGHLEPGQIALVEGEARAAGMGAALHRIGYVADDEVAVLYRAAVAHLLVSRAEGFGLTVVEAMASGCPVVTTRGGALAEVAGDAAITVDPDDHDAIGMALVRLARDSGHRSALVERGRARAPRFSLAVQARAMADVYRRFLNA